MSNLFILELLALYVPFLALPFCPQVFEPVVFWLVPVGSEAVIAMFWIVRKDKARDS